MANNYITPDVIAKEALMQLENSLVLGNSVHREYKKEFVKVGESVRLRKPVKFYTADGATRVNQDVEESSTNITIDQRKHVSWKFSTQDLTLNIEKYSERYIKPAMITLANTMDAAGYDLYKQVWNHVGTAGTTPNTFARVSPAAQRQTEMAVPMSERNLFLNPAAHYGIAGDQVGLQQQSMVSTAYKEAQIGRISGYNVMAAQNIKNHTTGTYTTGSTPLVNGADQDVAHSTTITSYQQTLITDGWATSTAVLKAGDVFTLAGVYAVNPVPGEGTTGKTVMPYLQEFTVLADASSDGTGDATITIAPPIITSGPYQTVSAAPADNAAMTMKSGTEATAYPQNLALHKNAFALVVCPLEMPDGAAFKARESHNGLSVRVIKDYDITNDEDIIRLDLLYGWKAIYPDLACRLTG